MQIRHQCSKSRDPQIECPKGGTTLAASASPVLELDYVIVFQPRIQENSKCPNRHPGREEERRMGKRYTRGPSRQPYFVTVSLL